MSDPAGDESAALGLTGKTLKGRYQVVSRLGQGGMASVYLAKDANLDGREVVVKVPHAALLVDPGFRKRFAGEVANLTRLEHPNIITITDRGEEDNVPFAVVQYLPGGDLGDRIRAAGGRLTPEQVMEWLPRVAETLDYIHEKGFLHRDVSPGNIIFDALGNPMLSDFGIATALTGKADPEETLLEYSNLTKPGGFVGAATYAPPESIERKLNAGYDQYSLGVVVYQALSGKLPFERGSSEAMLVAKNTQEPRPLEEVAPDLPAGVSRAVMRAISKDPAARFRTSREFVQAFREGMAVDLRPAPQEKTELVPELQLAKKARPRWPFALAGGALLLALVGAVVVIQRDDPSGGTGSPGSGTEATANADAGSTGAEATPAGAAAGAIEFRAGSTPAEQRQAYDLCVEYTKIDCDPRGYEDESIRVVRLVPESFELAATEVTNREFAAFAEATGHRTTAEKRGYSWVATVRGPDLSWRAPTREITALESPDYPVVHVSRFDAIAYCAWAGGRLPTEDEWELSARGEERRQFPWGDEWGGDRAVWIRTEPRTVRSVATHPAGATPTRPPRYDMAGNVWEWTSTEIEGDMGREGVMKGGSFLEGPAMLRSAARLTDRPDYSSSDVGFRCAKDLR